MSRTYTGIHTQIQRNNFRAMLLLLGFPLLLLGAVWLFFFLTTPQDAHAGYPTIGEQFVQSLPWVIGFTAIWFAIAWFSHSAIINSVTGAKPLERKENKRVYNLTENLCIAEGMPMPKLQIIEHDALNAFASGINKKSYRVTVTRGLINKLNDDELEGVIAHELAHIKNRDVRLLIISLIFVGIFSFVAQIAFRSMIYGSIGRARGGGGRKGGAPQVMIIIMILAIIAYLFSLVFRFALSRKREYMADADAARMTKRPESLANALRKISGNYKVDTVKSDDVAEMFIENQPDKSAGFMSFISGLFATHPPIDKRIKILEQF